MVSNAEVAAKGDQKLEVLHMVVPKIRTHSGPGGAADSAVGERVAAHLLPATAGEGGVEL